MGKKKGENMRNYNKSFEQFKNDIMSIYNMATSKEYQKDYNNKMVDKTWQYQKEYGFEIMF